MKQNNLPYRKNPGFKIPDDFFAGFEQEMMDLVNAPDSLKTDELNQMKGTGFKVPAGYFENFEEEFIKKNNRKSGRIISLFNRKNLLYAASVAAIFIGILRTIYFHRQPEASWDNVQLSALEDYLSESYDDGLIEINTAGASSSLFENNYLVDENDFEEVNPDAALDYLNENMDDPDYIFE
ncbi:MAG: hypothetical protein WBV11_08260 [Salegentibacter sp.]